MKSLIKLSLIALLVLSAANAADAKGRSKTNESRQELATRQARKIAESLALDDKTAARFEETYVKCQDEVWKQKADSRGCKAQLTEAQTDSMLRARMDRSRNLLDIREKYYKEYRKFLSAKQVNRVYMMEDSMGARFREARKARPARKTRPARKARTARKAGKAANAPAATSPQGQR